MEAAKRSIDPLLIDEAGHSECLLGNEAIVRGALESGVAFASGYPGTPSSEVTDTFARIAPELGIAFEYSVNEKIAVEMAFAASLAGARSICAMKHLGLMVAGDPISTIPYVGVEGGMVIVSAADPSCRTSPNEQDQRHLGPMLHLPVLDPSTPERAHQLTRFAFELSEQSRLPVLLRVTTRVCHSRTPVSYGPLVPPRVRGFVRNPPRYTPVPHNARRMRKELPARLERARQLIAESELGLLRRSGQGETVIVAAGAPAATCADLLRALPAEQQARVTLWTLEALYPLPEKQLLEILGSAERLLVVEELSPYLEDALRALGARHGLSPEILGKRSGHFPEEFEYEPPVIDRALQQLLGLRPGARPEAVPVPPRPPSLCPGCGHRAAYFAARAAFDEEQLFFNDIGCYTLGYGPPLETVDALLCMGAGFTLAAGVARVTGQRTVGVMGDSTFFHSGMPALLDAIKEDVNMVAVILDNQVTAMTGFQQSPTQAAGGPSIEAVVRALGARQVTKVHPYDLPPTIAAFRAAKEASGLSVVIVEQPCPVHQARRAGRAFGERTFEIDHARCRTCGREGAGLRCDQPLSEAYERNLAGARATQVRHAPGTGPTVAPCSTHCPLSLCVQGYTGHIAAGEYHAALGHILARTPLPETVCRVCHRPCEAACVRAGIDQAVAVNDLKRFVVQWAEAHDRYPEPACEPPSGQRVAVVGAGPSGLAAAHDLALRGHQVTVYDAADRPGGLLAHGIPAYRLPREALARDLARIARLGVELVPNTRLGEEITVAGLLERGFAAVYLALGAQRARSLDLAGADTPGAPTLTDALAFLRAVQDGGRACVPAAVVVVGGGNAAIDAARTARRLGAQRVTIACLEARAAMPALPEEIAAALAEGIALCPEVVPKRADRGGVVFGAVDDGARETLLEGEEVILAIGQLPDLAPLEKEPLLHEVAAGRLAIDPETGCTGHGRVFAGGDLVGRGEGTVTGAIAAGLRAAWAIDRELRGAEAADRRPPPRQIHAGGAWPAATIETEAVARHQPPERGTAERTAGFDEVIGGLTENEARAEAARCLICGICGNCRSCIDLCGCPAFREVDGRIEIDQVLCNGCGLCLAFCPNDAIRPREQQ